MEVSIIIPTFNRSDAISETLQVLSNITYPKENWEAIVVDDGSTDDTPEVIKRWITRLPIQIQYIRQVNAGAAAARNQGAWAAQGKILIFIDNDIHVPPQFIQMHVDSLNENPDCWIMGRVIHPQELRQTPFGRFRDDFHESFQRSYSPHKLSETNGMTSANISIPKKDFEALQGFDESFPGASCEDWELSWRARKHGIRVLFHPGIVVLHNDWAVSLKQFCQRQKLYSIPQVLLWKKYGSASPWAQLVCDNSPIKWKTDASLLIVKKLVKRLLASDPGEAITQQIGRWGEQLHPDSKLSYKAYNLAIAIAIYRGVQIGLRQY